MGEIADALRQADRRTPTGQTPQESPPRPIDEHRVARDLTRSAQDVDESDVAQAVPSSPPRPSPSRSDESAPRPSTPPKHLHLDGTAETAAARITIADPLGEATQQYRRIAFRIRELADDRGARSIVITSAQTQEGKTTTSCNLAIQLARLDQSLRVVLVDLDLHRASIAAAFGVEIETSIVSVLNGEHTLDEAIFETDVPGLSVLGLQNPTSKSEWLLAHPNLRAMIQDLEARFDFVIIDTPPVLATSDAQVILRHASAGLFIARAGQTSVKAVRRALEHIPSHKLLGSLLNSSPGAKDLSNYPYYGISEAEDESGHGHEASEPGHGQ